MRLQFKVILLVLGILVGIGLVGGGILIDLQRSAEEGHFKSYGITMASYVKSYLAQEMLEGESAHVQRIVGWLSEYPSVNAVTVYGFQGQILAATDASEVGGIRDDPSVERVLRTGVSTVQKSTLEGNHQRSFFFPIENQAACGTCHSPIDMILGVIRVDLDASLLAQHTREQATMVGLFVLAGCLATTSALAVAFRSTITKRLARLVRMTAVVTGGDYSARSQERDKDEIGSLGRAFDHMAESLQEQERLKSEFLAMVSHELKTPLGLIGNAIELLEDDPRLLPPQHDLVSTISHSTDRLRGLVDDLLDLARLEAGQMEITVYEVDVGKAMEEVWWTLKATVDGKGQRVRVDFPQGLAPVLADPGRLEQILLILLTNAIRHTSEGSIITLRAREDGRFVVVEVEDNGPGIPEDMRSKLFDRFYRWGPRSGSGLGLAIAKHLVELQGGTIWVRSSPGKGSTFAFTLPRQEGGVS